MTDADYEWQVARRIAAEAERDRLAAELDEWKENALFHQRQIEKERVESDAVEAERDQEKYRADRAEERFGDLILGAQIWKNGEWYHLQPSYPGIADGNNPIATSVRECTCGNRGAAPETDLVNPGETSGCSG